ncbi:unnamed protein product [Mycolicibacterium canariasense]|uniref:Uncharacterized protein n=1 Tax=Mycolicibacterium canariasense TaxID=228230 RepID=A0A124E238_MYCCR|nr:hypothetical protein [Mycolicibacterium canariasense]MCV7212569.1 hypothetical protein [Mycolicibacterium canariasense]GAS95570.1 unnamed protein product [Mycolicibacterium canariasense]
MSYLAGQLAALAVMAALVGGVVWAVLVMREPRPPLEDDDEPELTD